MHETQAQFTMRDITGGIVFSGSIRHETATDAVSMNSHTIVAGANLTLSFVAIPLPHRVIVKKISGDPILISLNNGTNFPLQLDLPEDFSILRINPAAIPTIVLSVPTGTANATITIES